MLGEMLTYSFTTQMYKIQFHARAGSCLEEEMNAILYGQKHM